MQIWQAAAIGLLCYLGSILTPWLMGPTGGWYVLTRPLVAGLLCGLILGNVQEGVLIGIAVQAVYIGLITPGGALPADLSFVSYLGIPLALVAHASPDVAVSLSVGFGVIGIAAFQILIVGGAVWPHMADRYAEKGNLNGIATVNWIAQIPSFLLRGVLPFLILLFGADSANAFITFLNVQAPWIVQLLGLVGGALPAVGIAILLLQIAPNFRSIAWFLLGWVLLGYLKLPLVGVAVIGGIAAYIYFQYFSRTDLEQSTPEVASVAQKEV